MNFSIVFPSRDRPRLLRSCLHSIATNSADIAAVEVLVAVDRNDVHTAKHLPELEADFPFLKVTRTAQQRNFSEGYYNPLAAQSSGRFILLLNDDCEIVTPGWDALALVALDEYQQKHPDGIFLGCPKDDTGCPYSCFPLLPRSSYEVLGYAQHPAFTSWGADIFIDKVFGWFERRCRLPFQINHKSHHNKQRARDRVNRRMGMLMQHVDENVAIDEMLKLRKVIRG